MGMGIPWDVTVRLKFVPCPIVGHFEPYSRIFGFLLS